MGRPKRGAAAAAEKAIKGDDAKANKKSKAGLAVGDDIPSFQLETDTETTVSSADLVKDNGIVLFCYPKANTAGCTTQAVGLSEKTSELAEAGFKVYGISADKPKSQANWKKKADITCTLLCDPSQEVLPELGFIKGGKINRSHIIVAKGGKVLDVQYGVKPKDSIKHAVEFCLANKAEPLSADAANEEAEEAAAAAPEEPSNEELKQEEEAAPAPADEADDKADDEQADEAKGDAGDEGAAAMDVDGATDAAADAAADAEAPQQQEEEKKEEQNSDKAAADTAEPDKEAEQKEEEPAAEHDKPADEATGDAEAAAAPDEPVGDDEAAAAAAADEGDAQEPAAETIEDKEPAEADNKEEGAAAEQKTEATKDETTEAPAAAEAYAA